MKNLEHSISASNLFYARGGDYIIYLYTYMLAKENIRLNCFDKDHDEEWCKQICISAKYMLPYHANKIKKLKRQIYAAQTAYSRNHANQQPSQPLTKLEGSETRI